MCELTLDVAECLARDVAGLLGRTYSTAEHADIQGAVREAVERSSATILSRLADATPGAAPSEGVTAGDMQEMRARNGVDGLLLSAARYAGEADLDGTMVSVRLTDLRDAVPALEALRSRLASPSPARSDLAADRQGDGVAALFRRALDAAREETRRWHAECDRIAALASAPTPAREGVDLAEVERLARQIAADKMGLIKDPTGAKLPDELWRQCIPQALEAAIVARLDPQADKVDALRVALSRLEAEHDLLQRTVKFASELNGVASAIAWGKRKALRTALDAPRDGGA